MISGRWRTGRALILAATTAVGLVVVLAVPLLLSGDLAAAPTEAAMFGPSVAAAALWSGIVGARRGRLSRATMVIDSLAAAAIGVVALMLVRQLPAGSPAMARVATGASFPLQDAVMTAVVIAVVMSIAAQGAVTIERVILRRRAV